MRDAVRRRRRAAAHSCQVSTAHADGRACPNDFPHVALAVLNPTMGDRDDFLGWFNTTWREAEVALHHGDAEPRNQTWSERGPVTLFGAWLNAYDPAGVRDVFQKLGQAFSEATSSDIELIAAEVSGDLAYTAHREFTSTRVNGEEREYVLRVTQVYRRENGTWKVVHRHGDTDPDVANGP